MLRLAAGAGAQGDTIVVGEDRPVRAGPDLPLVEPHLALNPRNSLNLIAGAMVAQPDGMYRCIGLSSRDGGAVWQSHDFGVRDCGDVWVAFLADGTALFSMLADEGSELRVYRSTDGGRAWESTSASLGRGHDHPTLLVDVTSPRFAGSIYTVSSVTRRGTTGQLRSAVFVARSSDNARTFATPRYVVASNLSYEANNPALLSDGTVLIPFADHRRPGDRRRLERQRDWLVVSSDGGNTFSEPLLIAETCNGAGGWSSLAASPRAGRFPDRIYHVCSGTQFADIQLRYSDDRGETWSDPTVLAARLRVTPYARTPAIAVNKDGVVAVAWYDGRNDRSTIKGSLRCQEIYFAASTDGGVTFSPETRVSNERSCPAGPRNAATALRFPAGGEYFGLIALPDGSFRLLWSDARSGVYQLRTATSTLRRR
jgi:hypothetical protein